MSVTGPPEGPPSKVGVAVADVLTGLYAAIGILAGLRARETSGHGYHIDLALLDCAVADADQPGPGVPADRARPAAAGERPLPDRAVRRLRGEPTAGSS